ncbi:hypothetical protein EYF80_033681 [Liparis tanakae]|uniref:Uncharacterized protein n=1 Tax=Liparis tanakae TaxID=230148 RepID=A0A4Z2GS52_9TELE|nr:hypothetical protein EYF80_033681 [Liparis tanakae]
MSMASKAWAQSFRRASHVLRHGLIILSSRHGEATTEQPSRRISGEHSPLRRPWMTLSRRYSGPDSASARLRWPRMLGNMVLRGGANDRSGGGKLRLAETTWYFKHVGFSSPEVMRSQGSG